MKATIFLIMVYSITFNVFSQREVLKIKPTEDIDTLENNQKNDEIDVYFSAYKINSSLFLLGINIPYFSYDFSLNMKKLQSQLADASQDDFENDQLKYSGLLPDLYLGKDSKIVISGRKSVKMGYNYRYYPDVLSTDVDQTASSQGPKKFDTKFNIEQQMQVKVEGQIRNRIFINVDYDDTLEQKDRQNITIQYKGKEDEILQHAEIGNITLSLPNTEFISFSKKLFGIRTYSKIGAVKHFMILSKQEGETSSSSYSGTTMVEQRDILDLNYARNFFKLPAVFDNTYNPGLLIPVTLPVKIHIYGYDGNPDPGQNRIKVEHDGKVYYFEEYELNKDFFFDNTTGIIEMKRTEWLREGYLAVGLEYTASVSYGILSQDIAPDQQIPIFLWKSPEKSSPYQMKNKYVTGINNIDINSFKIKILRENKDESIVIDDVTQYYVNIFNLSKDATGWIFPLNLDTTTGVITFPNELPFDLTTYDPGIPGLTPELREEISNKTIYNTSGQKSKYTIRYEYQSPVSEYRLNAFDIIEGSERVVVDGRVLVRGEHYRIDYMTGVVSIIDQSQINVNSNVQITFEYRPFFAAQSKTLFGTRLEYDYKDEDKFKLGATYISESSPDVKDDETPRFGEEPFSNTVYGINALATLDDSLIKGLKLKMRAEFAQSEIDPNTTGKVLIDDMEGSEMIRSLSMNRASWFAASMPSNVGYSKENRYHILNVNTLKTEECFFLNKTIENDDIRPNFGNSTRTSLFFRQLPSDGAKFFSFAQRISKLGEDFSQFKYIEIWYRLDTNALEGKQIVLELGSIGEDSDGDGVFDTEDDNQNGLVDSGEDVGYDFNISDTITVKYGDSNNIIDDEDPSGDGNSIKEDPPGMQRRYTLTLERPDENNGWVIARIPLSDFDGHDSVLSSVQFFRIFGHGFDTGGTMHIAKIDIVGTVWEADENSITPGNTLTISTIDNISSAEYVPLHNVIDKDTEAVKKDVSVSLNFLMDNNYSNLEPRSGFCTKDYGSPRDLTKYKTFRVYYFPQNHPEVPPYAPNPYKLVIRLLTTSSDYYEFSKTIQPSDAGWEYVEVSLQNSQIDTVGNPSLQSITKMQIGVSSVDDQPFRGILYINDMLLMNTNKLIGDAGSFEFSTSFKDFGAISYYFMQKDGTYSLIGETPRNIDTKSQSLSMRFDPGRLLFGQKVSTATSLTLNSSKTTNNNDIIVATSTNAGENKSDRMNFSTVINIQKYPTISYNYNFSRNINAMINDPTETVSQGQNARLDYAVPSIKTSVFTLTPSKISLSYGEQRNKTVYTFTNQYNQSSLSNDWNADVAWNPVDKLQLSGRYTLREQWDLKRELFTSQNQTTNVTGSYTRPLHKYISIRSNYSAVTSLFWDLRTAESLNKYYVYRVNGVRNYSSGLSVSLIDYVDFIPIFTQIFDVTADYSNALVHNYDQIEEKPDLNFYLGNFSTLESDFVPKLKTDTNRYSFEHKTALFRKITTRLVYGLSRSETINTSGISRNESREWPSGSMTLSDWTGIPLLEYFQKNVTVQSLVVSYKQTESTSHSTTEIKSITRTPSVSWNITWKNNIRTDLRYTLMLYERYQSRLKPVSEQTVNAAFHADYTITLKRRLSGFMSENEREVPTSLMISGDISYNEKTSENSSTIDDSIIRTILACTYNFSDEMRLNAGFSTVRFRTKNITLNYNEYKLEVGFEVLF